MTYQALGELDQYRYLSTVLLHKHLAVMHCCHVHVHGHHLPKTLHERLHGFQVSRRGHIRDRRDRRSQ